MAKKSISYLESLRFDPKLLNTWWAKYIVQFRLVIMLLLLIIVIGIFAYMNIPRRLNPEVNIAIVMINTSLPGASPEDVEQLVTIPLEDVLDSVEDIDTMTSSSVEGNANIVMQFRSGVDGDKAKDDVQSAVDTIHDLPEDATDPRVQKLDFEDEPVWTFSITGKADTASLMRFSTLLKDRLEDSSRIDRVTTSGLDEQDIEVVLLPERVAEFGVTPQQIAQAIRIAAGSFPAGNVETETSTFSLTIDKEITSVEDIRNIRLTVAGQSVRLGDIAHVSFISKTNQNQAFLASEQTSATPTVQFFVYRAKTVNIDVAEKEAQTIVEKTRKEYNGTFSVTTISNYAVDTEEEFTDLAREFSITVFLVFVLLLLFLGLRQALISSLVVPLTFLSSFAIIYAMGLSLNFLTMFSFLIALGVLIDDAIVVVAAMTRYYATGKFTPAETGVLVWRDFIVPLISTAITTVWAFVPLLLASGIIGEFIKSIPIVVSVTMLSSTVIAILITLPLMIIFLKPQFPKRVSILLKTVGIILLLSIPVFLAPFSPVTPVIVLFAMLLLFVGHRTRATLKKAGSALLQRNKYTKRAPAFMSRVSNKGLLDIEVVSRWYMRVIDRVLISRHGKRNTLIAIIVFTVVAYLLVPLGMVKNEFFPGEDAELLYISVELSPGTNLTTNKNEMLAVLHQVRNTEEVSYVVGETGAGFASGMGRTGASSAFLLTLHLTPVEERSIESSEIAQKLREQFAGYTKGEFTVQEQSGGPPAGADVQITILGDDLTVLDQYANSVVQFLESQPGVTNVNKSIKPGTSKLVFELDKDKLAENNLTTEQVSLWLRTYASGFTLDTIKFGDEEEDIVFKITSQTQTPEDLGRISIPAGSSSVPLLSLGELTLATNPTTISREKGKRTITITGSVVAPANAQEVNQKLAAFADNGLQLQEGYRWQTGGANEENEKSVQSILQAMVLSMLLIFVTMVIEFRSFRQTLIALMFIPISVAGVFYVFALTQTPLSFPALIGVLALFGIVVRHAIVVIEKINDDLKEGMTVREAVVDAAGNRLEPVVLTSLAAIVGLIPITISDPLWRGLGGAIIAGLLFSWIIKLFFIPVTFYLMFPEKKEREKK